ncbi:2-ketogluconate reductase [Apiospora aurea]|uniref:2-ketogluconate reductase n=1 Tax=Apiospora aurea TaxID=335848 RepID=A0ABR1QUC9_9PEZI
MGKPFVLHIGDPIKYNDDFYTNEFCHRFQVVRNDCPDRLTFMQALKDKKFGDFSAIYRPHSQTGGEMGHWDEELLALLPASVSIFASAGAGYNWADVEALGRRGIWYANGAGASDEAVSDTGLYMILSVFRNFTRSQLAVRTCDPERFNEAHRLIVNEDALIAALRSGRLAAAALDAHYHEPQVSQELAAMENVTLTTHVGGGALDTRINFELGTMKNILAVVGEKGEIVGEPLTPVNEKSMTRFKEGFRQ